MTTTKISLCCRGCSFDFASSYFFRPNKVWSMLHHGSVGTSSEQNLRNLILALNLNLLLPSIVFHYKICIFVMIFTALSFLWLIHGLYFALGGNVRLCVSLKISKFIRDITSSHKDVIERSCVKIYFVQYVIFLFLASN